MRFSAGAVMYVVRINGGSLGNEFSTAANNKESQKKREERAKAGPVRSATATGIPK